MSHSATSQRRTGGIVLCGGQSLRMGVPKLALPFGPELMLPRVCRLLSEAVSPIVVVAAREQQLPPLPDEILIARDEYATAGPLAGIATGLGALRGIAEAAFVTACDAPLLNPEFVQRIISRFFKLREPGHCDAAVPVDEQFTYGLAAVYSVELEIVARTLLKNGQRRVQSLIESIDCLCIPTAELRDVDPALLTLRSMNSPDEYAAALEIAGLRTPGG